MVAILAFLTFTVFIVAAWILARREDAATSGVPAPQAASLALPAADIATPSIVGHARALTDWHARHRHCAVCGGATLPVLAGAHRRCPDCSAELV